MRDILFRGKTEEGEWVEGFLTQWSDGDYQIKCGFENAGVTRTVITETVGQYTGLTDKNGKKIFEGDIVKDRENALHIVKIGEYFPDHYLRLCCHSLEPIKLCNLYGVYAERITNDKHKGDHFVIPPKNAVEVIGNIHDNPELLKEGAE